MPRNKQKRYIYHARIDPESLPRLQALAADLGFYINHPGASYGEPSPPSLFDDLAATYAANPTAVANALRSLGISGTGPPPERDFLQKETK